MERFRFDSDAAFTPDQELLERVTIAPLTPPGGFQAAVFRVSAGGRIVRHPATVPQILAVLEGEGRVSGADGELEPIAAGEAVFWPAGEEHETTSDGGLTALVLEGEGLGPPRARLTEDG
jgi:quercetin dioxygenase-like cupin family protein